MATTLYFHERPPDTHRSANTARLDGTSTGWTPRGLGVFSPNEGSMGITTNTVAGPTNGVECAGGGTTSAEWLSPPLSADVTISGAITANLYAFENNMSANVAINFVVDKVSATDGTVTQIVKSARTTELGTSSSLQSFSATPGAGVSVNRGDRLRVRVFGDDSTSSMASGFTFTFSYGNNIAPSSIQFTETFDFEPFPVWFPNRESGAVDWGTTTIERSAMRFRAPFDGLPSAVYIYVDTVNGTPADNIRMEIQSDSAGVPSETVICSAETGTYANATWSGLTSWSGTDLTKGTTYWLVWTRSGSLSATNYWSTNNAETTSGLYNASTTFYQSGAWQTPLDTTRMVKMLPPTSSTTQIFLTNTASDVATASNDKEAWTSRGAGVTAPTTNTSAGWTSGIQMTDAAGGTVIDWFTKKLAAVTLGGLVFVNVWGTNTGTGNFSMRIEVARVDSDGTNPTVWASWCIEPYLTGTASGKLPTGTDVLVDNRRAYISGDDLTISDQQRLRIRLYLDDTADAAMPASSTGTVRYAGTAFNTNSDFFLIFPASLSEYVPVTFQPRYGFVNFQDPGVL